MADIINFADWAALQALIEQGNTAVSGMTAAEAQAALNATANSNLYVYNSSIAAGSGNIINFPNASTAAEAAAQYASSGGTTSASGAATAATGAAEQAANLTIVEGASGAGSSGVAGLLSVSLPTAAAAIAPVAGVALGIGLYELAPDFWETVSRTLLPFCYEDSELIPVAVDANGQTYFPKEAIDALTPILKNATQGGATIDDTTGLNERIPRALPIPVGTPDTLQWTGSYNSGRNQNEPLAIGNLVATSPVYTFGVPMNTDVSRGIYYCLCSKEPFSFTSYSYNRYGSYSSNITARRYVVNDSVVYIGRVSNSSVTLTSYSLEPTNFVANLESFDYELGYVILYGTVSPAVEGVTRWDGNEYPEEVTPLKPLTAFDSEGNPIFTPFYPLSIPTSPGITNDPSVNPSPVTNPEPAPAINPYISPMVNPNQYPQPWTYPYPDPAPLPNPVPQPQPTPDPDVDPTREPDPDSLPENPNTPTTPKDDGNGDPPIIPVIPTLPSSGSGLLHVYNPTQTQIDAFGSWLWTTFSGDLIDTLSKLFNDPMDAVIGLHELYATPAVSGSGTIRAGYLDSHIASNLVGSRYTTINCGSVVVEEYYQNYLDYSPYTQCYIYLPFIGIVSVNADDIIGNAVNIAYHIDSYTGCCIAVITVAREGYSSTVYQFEGNCAVEIPISSGYQSALMSGLLAVAGTAITGNPAVGLTAAHVGRAGLGKNAVQHSGSFGSSYGAMGAKIPYIIVRRPVQKKVLNYSQSYGYPAHKMVYVGNCNGYLRAREVRVTSTTATNIEKEMIVNALKEGVYVR